MEMDLNAVLQQILAFSKRHLQHTVDEQWEEWEDLFNRKRGLCERLREFSGVTPDAEGLRTIHEIQMVEARNLDALRGKRAATLMKLKRIGRQKNVLAGYGAATNNNVPGHFGVRC